MSAHVPPSESTPPSLLLRAQKQEAGALGDLVKWIGPFILRWCRHPALQEADCEDLAQEVRVKLCAKIGEFRKDKESGSFRSWVRVMTKRCVIDWRRTRKRPIQPLPADLPAPDDKSESLEMKRRALQLLLEKLLVTHANDRGFQAFYQTAVNGLSAVKVARDLTMTPDQVRHHKARWTKRLRDQLGEQFSDLLE